MNKTIISRIKNPIIGSDIDRANDVASIEFKVVISGIIVVVVVVVVTWNKFN